LNLRPGVNYLIRRLRLSQGVGTGCGEESRSSIREMTRRVKSVPCHNSSMKRKVQEELWGIKRRTTEGKVGSRIRSRHFWKLGHRGKEKKKKKKEKKGIRPRGLDIGRKNGYDQKQGADVVSTLSTFLWGYWRSGMKAGEREILGNRTHCWNKRAVLGVGVKKRAGGRQIWTDEHSRNKMEPGSGLEHIKGTMQKVS